MKKWTINIGSYFGIKVFIHWTFWIIIIWILLLHFKMGHGWAEGLKGILFILALFACVVFHEFGHALTAKRYGIPTRNITLYPIGGVASLNKMPDKPAQELAVALAGPAVNLILAGFIYFFLDANNQVLPLSEIDHMSGNDFWFNLLVANVVLAVFNLIPAFPMDGGRVLRALLALNMDKLQATTIAVRVGQFLAIVFVFLGFFTNFWLVFIGLFIYLGAGAEVVHETAKSTLTGYTAKDILVQPHTRFSPHDSLEKAVQLSQNTHEQGFIVEDKNRVQGILTRKELVKGFSEYGKASPVSSIMQKNYITFLPNAPLQEVYQKLLDNNLSMAPIMENDKLIGIVDVKGINELIMIKKNKKR
tara:strand:+ start:3354 stop:4436 length:1083 start_codon:yes stop_codon:yes gene_type:complete